MTAQSLSLLKNPEIQAQLLRKVSEEVAEIEQIIRESTNSRVDLIRQVSKQILDAGGKRIRPAFVILSGKVVNPDADMDRLRKLGACMEIIHMATLVHDDVIDSAGTRRGKPTAAAAFGNTTAIMSGDVFLAKAMALLAADGDVEVFRTVADAVCEIAEGEVIELEARGDFDLDEDQHLEILQMKTASFIRCCCELGAIVAGATKAQRESLALFGQHTGMAFQIADDLLDYRGDKAKTGKPIATDFRDGQATLPLIYLRDNLSEAESHIARRRFGGSVNEDEIRMICDWMDTRGAFAKAEALGSGHISTAHDRLDELDESLARDMLHAVADYVIARQS
ncbi:MAG: polyprenyl synthetase family protein [Armatimonadota bacterium]